MSSSEWKYSVYAIAIYGVIMLVLIAAVLAVFL